MQFWRATVAPWIVRPVHLTIIVSENVIQGTTVRGRCAPGAVLVSTASQEVNPGSSVGPSPPFVNQGEKADAARKALIEDTILFVVKNAGYRLAPQNVFVTRGLYATWRHPTVSGSALTLGFGATNRADKLFECLTPARLVLKVFALQRESTRNGPHESKQKRVPYLGDALNTRLGPLQWDLMASDANAQLLTEGGVRYPITRGGLRRAQQGLMCSRRP